jgi:glycosyltransferase involved in cell wall biosynthesis
VRVDFPTKEHILIFEPLSSGHRAEFISHLIDFIQRSEEKATYTFVLGRGLGEGIPAASSRITIREISEKEQAVLDGSQGPLGAFGFRKILQVYLDELHPGHVLLMDLTYLELALCFRRMPCGWSGILFVQYPELLSGVNPGWKQRLKFRLKEIKTGLLLRDARLRNVFLLNGNYSCNYLNHRFRTTCFRSLPDPILDIEAEEAYDLRRQYALDEQRCLFLFFGSMSPRKGVAPLVNALKRLPQEIAEASAFLFCGIPEPGYATEYRVMIESLVSEHPDLKIVADEHYVSPGRMRALFQQADWVLLPYVRPEYSSGILGHAAVSQTPVIGASSGLLGRQIREYGLGLDVEITIESLVSAISRAVQKGYELDGTAIRTFVEASTPEHFASVLLES